ncbi:solute carrier family 36 (proton-coupled amino acid transporter) [Paragonimus westermani]|uniref:Solute carrier family 36 (Proton-coupled amino acid transporter) n=1 Tax=Paragonimus westermani TaxID=34504 RepID=A0A5J4NRM0_9TREM|nr:solute carrier family 36 (proton-coupled amino acid transporter) [Paragonimus westermani]
MNDSNASSVIQLEERAVESDTAASTDLLSSNSVFVETTPHVREHLSEPETLMSFIKSNLGTGMLSMSIVLRYMGLWIGFFTILVAGFISTYLMNVLVRTTRSVRQRHTVNVFLLITQIGFLCVYVLFLTENIRRTFIFLVRLYSTGHSRLVCTPVTVVTE